MSGGSPGSPPSAGAAERRASLDPDALRAVRRPLTEAATLPASLFTDPVIFEMEQRRLFQRTWTCLGREDEFLASGSLRTYEVGGSGVVVVRDLDGALRAFHNVCRHRGTRLVEDSEAQGRTNIQCPYHAWTYDLKGQLRGAPHMAEVTDFDKADHGLFPVPLETWRGFVFVNLDPGAEPLAAFLGGFMARAAPYPLERLRRAHRVVYEIAANWKLVVENANECYHCPGVHPQLVRITPYTSGEEDLLDGPVFGGWMDLVNGARSLSATGQTARASFPALSVIDRARAYYYVLWPANFFALLPDYVTLDWFVPLGPDRTRLVFDLYVDRDEPDPATDAMDFWETTNRQDWHICELAHLGAKTVAYGQGRYSTQEEAVHAVDRYYVDRMGFLTEP